MERVGRSRGKTLNCVHTDKKTDTISSVKKSVNMEGVAAWLTNNQAGNHTIHNVVKKQLRGPMIKKRSVKESCRI